MNSIGKSINYEGPLYAKHPDLVKIKPVFGGCYNYNRLKKEGLDFRKLNLTINNLAATNMALNEIVKYNVNKNAIYLSKLYPNSRIITCEIFEDGNINLINNSFNFFYSQPLIKQF